MPFVYVTPLFLIMTVWALPAHTQSSETDSTELAYTYFTGIGVDIFPVLNGIFSDGPSPAAITVTFLWGRTNRLNELGFSPSYSRRRAGVTDPELTSIGIDARMFHGNTHKVGEKWLLALGFTYRYHFIKEQSTINHSGFKFTTSSHSGALGPELIFGFHITDRVWIRSRVAGLANYTLTETKILDGQHVATDQKIKSIGFNIAHDALLELVYFF